MRRKKVTTTDEHTQEVLRTYEAEIARLKRLVEKYRAFIAEVLHDAR